MSFLQMADKAWEKADEFRPNSPRWAFLAGAIVGVISGIGLGLLITFSPLESVWQIASLLVLGGSAILIIFAILANEDGTFRETVTASFSSALGFILGCLSITFVFWAFATFQTIHAIAAVFIPIIFAVAGYDEWRHSLWQEEKTKITGSEDSEETPPSTDDPANHQGTIATW